MTAPPPAMRVPVFVGGGRIEFAERPVPDPGPGELLLRVAANALCGSEALQYQDGAPVTPGHEAAGTVAAAGPGTRTPVGTPGVVYLMDYCGACRSCRVGATNQCLDKRADYGFTADGGYAPYQLVRERVFFPVDADLPLGDATMLLDVMGTSAHALERVRVWRPDVETLLVAGAGPVGLGLVAMARLLLGHEARVLVSDVAPPRLALAESLGALPVDLTRGDLAAGLRAHGLAEVDAAVDASGRRAAREAAVAALGRRGVLACVGHGEGVALEVSRDLIAPERAVVGSEYFRFDELPANLALLRAHRAYLAPIITHRFGLDEIGTAFQLFWRGGAGGRATGKVLVEHAGAEPGGAA